MKMRFKILISFQFALCVLAIVQKYLFLKEECVCFPNDDIFFLLISTSLVIIALIEIVRSLKNKNWKFLYFIIPFPVLIAAVYLLDPPDNRDYSDSIIFNIEKTGDRSETFGITIYLNRYGYTLANHWGEECGCTYSGTFLFTNDTIKFDRNLRTESSKIITDDFIYLKDYIVKKESGQWYTLTRRESLKQTKPLIP